MVTIGQGNWAQKIPENKRLERIWVLTKSEFIQRYYGSFLGVFWAFLNPLFQLLIFYFIFTWFFETKIQNYALYVLSGLLMWMFFSETTRKGLLLLKNKKYLYENIPINKLDIFVASISSTLIALIINFIIYFIVSLFMPVDYGFSIIMFPVILVLACLFIFSVSIILSLLNVFLEDIDHVWDIALLAIFWTIPLFYQQDLISEQYRFLIFLNPMTGLVINLREVLLLNQWPSWDILLYETVVIAALLGISILLFKRFHFKSAEKL